MRSSILLAAALVSVLLSAHPQAAPMAVDVTMYHNDPSRTGQFLHETQLTPAAVNAVRFGKRFAAAVDGQVYAQPLYVAGLVMEPLAAPGVVSKGQGRHNVVFVATEHDSVYAFDAESGATLWHRSFLDTGLGVGVTTVPYADLPGRCQQITPELGITATPALEVDAGTLYVVAMTKETVVYPHAKPAYHQRLHALNIANGAERAGSPVDIQATVSGTGDGGSQDVFVPLDYKERPGLVLNNGVLYTFWSSHCDAGVYHGWVMSFNAATLEQKSVYNVTANGAEASFWDSGAAPAVDAAGNLYLGAGNGTFDMQNENGSLNPAGVDLGESFLRLSTTPAGAITPADWFTPFNKNSLNDADLDIGSSGVVLYDVGGNHLLTGAGKEGRIYVLHRGALGHFSPGADTGAFQTVPVGDAGITGGLFGCPAYFLSAHNGPTLYFAAVGDHPKAFVLDAAGKLPAAPTSQGSSAFGYPGAVPAISANGGADGVVWLLENSATLHAYDADNLGTELYNSSQNIARDALGSYVKFTTPIIAQGRVYAGTNDHLVAYGLLNPTPAKDLTARFTITRGEVRRSANGNQLEQDVILVNHGAEPVKGPVSLVLDHLNKAATLANANGTTAQTPPLASFYKMILPVSGTGTEPALEPGGSMTVQLKFDNTRNSHVSWVPRVLGAGDL